MLYTSLNFSNFVTGFDPGLLPIIINIAIVS